MDEKDVITLNHISIARNNVKEFISFLEIIEIPEIEVVFKEQL